MRRRSEVLAAIAVMLALPVAYLLWCALSRRRSWTVRGHLVDLPTLHEKQREWAQTQAASFEDYMRRTRDANFTADRGWPMRALD